MQRSMMFWRDRAHELCAPLEFSSSSSCYGENEKAAERKFAHTACRVIQFCKLRGLLPR